MESLRFDSIGAPESQLESERRARGRARQWLVDVLVITALFALCYGFMLGSRALWSPDEGRYTEIPREMLISGDFLTPHLDGVKYFEKPPLFYWLQAGALRVFGLNEWSARLWPMLFSWLGGLAVYAAGRCWYGRRAGLAAVGVLATSLLYYFLGRTVILDMALTTLLSGALLAFLQGTRQAPGTPRRVWLWTAYALMALAVLTKGLIGIVLPGMVIGAWIMLLGEWRLLRTLAIPSGLLLFLLIAAPWHVLVSAANPEFPYFYFIQQHFLRYLTDAEHRYQPNWFFIPVLMFGLFPWTMFLPQALRRTLPTLWSRRHEHRETLFLVLWASVVFGFFSLSHSKLVPYLLPVFPPLALLLGRYLAAADRGTAGWRRGLMVLAAVNLSGLLGCMLVINGVPHSAGVAELVRLTGAGLYAVAGAFGIALLGALYSLRVPETDRVMLVLMSCAMLFYFALGYAMVNMDDKYSVRELALQVQPKLRPEDTIATYGTYYQDLPVYLRRRITIVEWTNELAFGAGHQDTRAWMISARDLWAKWRGPARVILFANTDDLPTLRDQAAERYFFLAGNKYHVLVSNAPNPP